MLFRPDEDYFVLLFGLLASASLNYYTPAFAAAAAATTLLLGLLISRHLVVVFEMLLEVDLLCEALLAVVALERLGLEVYPVNVLLKRVLGGEDFAALEATLLLDLGQIVDSVDADQVDFEMRLLGEALPAVFALERLQFQMDSWREKRKRFSRLVCSL